MEREITEREKLQEYTVKYYEDQLIKGIENFHPGGIDYTEKLAVEVGVREGTRILDVASGSGETALYLAMRFKAEMVGFDVSEKMVTHATERAKNLGLGHLASFRRGDVHKMPFERGFFDAAISECSLCLFRDKVQVIRNMAHVVKSGQKVAISDVITKGEIPKELHTPLLYACCLAGAQPLEETMEIFVKAGLKDVLGYELTADIKDPWKKELPVLYNEVMNAFKDAIRLGVYEPKDESELDRMAERLLSEKFGYAIVSGIVL
jgi:ubiquinone/menaquinone biosynthesis C-methylase UbiE